MTEPSNSWLADFAAAAETTDRFKRRSDQLALLVAGLIGETGSLVSEAKKDIRESAAYPTYRRQIVEELGDTLWYFVRLTSLVRPTLLQAMQVAAAPDAKNPSPSALRSSLELSSAVGKLADALTPHTIPDSAELDRLFLRVWELLAQTSYATNAAVHEAVQSNLQKIRSRWPDEEAYHPLFDDTFPPEERLPRHLEVEFRQATGAKQATVILRCNSINIGDRLTDNMADADDYRFHDIFHFAHAVYLGWSPVIRALLHCKRKSDPRIDEVEDGARAAITEEGIATVVFGRAKHLNFFEGLDHVDLGLLKTIKEFTSGYEVDSVPLWQWDRAIIEGYRVFRLLRQNRGGHVTLDIATRELKYAPVS